MAWINIDVDDVVLDFTGSLKQLTGLSFKEHPHDRVWKAIRKVPNFYQKLSVKKDAYELLQFVLTEAAKLGYDVRFCTALPDFWECPSAMRDKTISLNSHFSCFNLPIAFAEGSERKWLYAVPGDILIDDYGRNCADWVLKGGGVAFKYDQSELSPLDSLKQQWLNYPFNN